MKILTWNINGIRAVTGKAGVGKLLKSLDADIVCLQETKVTRDMLDEPIAIVEGYESYFSFSRKRTGYSGTANYCSKHSSPVKAEEGLTGRLQVDAETSVGCYGNFSAYSEKDLDALDAEGRCVITQHKLRLKDGTEKDVAIINVYVPRAGDRPERLVYKLKFLTLLRSRAEALLNNNVHVIILGDLNLTHTAKDNCDPNSDADFLRRSSRIWINNLLRPSEREKGIAQSHPDLEEVALSEEVDEDQSDDGDDDGNQDDDDTEDCSNKAHKVQKKKGKRPKANSRRTETDIKSARKSFSDVYRCLHPEETTGYTNWDTSTDARKSNYGRRLDYILIDTQLAEHVTDCSILTEVEGSDHCPVVVTLDCHPLPCTAALPPQLCSKLMPEFRGQQQKLSSFFTKTVISVGKNSDSSSPSSSQESSCTSQEAPVVEATTCPQPQLKKSSSTPAPCGYSQEKPSLKRSAASAVGRSALPQKKAKQVEQKGPRQASLSSFFAPKPSKSVISASSSDLKVSKAIPKEVDEDVICVEEKQCDKSSLESDNLSSDNRSDTRDSKTDPSTVHSEVNETNGQFNKSTVPTSVTKSSLSSSQSWKSLLSGPAPAPLCPGHKEPCVLKTVRKNGPNKNKQFYSCSRPDGPPGNPQFRCNFFQWLHDRQKKKT
ncbi:DNA-(apurinic or apyrimidinic site) lyase [Plakobranchus ocellatus]|uniref:DNA-(apurinic or apyrimidinic site) endonuclease n=1 Tax=Plakobranchus ocellatus TaxID=259542 RepID=A0AAV3YPZ1_9GAST|nr:DNA-(apurinic or apyrimidinic site) lyase [Plakobranchus ocellatus]